MGGPMRQHHSFLDGLVGRRLTYVARVLYEYRGEIGADDGAIEVGTDRGVVLLEGDRDGESLRIRAEAWEDPFKEPLSEENRRYVDEHGRWRRVDVSKQQDYRDLIGERITRASLLTNEHGRIGGVRLSISTRDIWFVVEGDECHVRWAHPIGFVEGAPAS